MAGNSRDRRPNVVKKASTRKNNSTPILIAVFVIGAGVLVYAMARKPATDATPAEGPAKVDVATAGPPQGYLIGKPDAPVKIVEFADFECPACGRFATITEPDVRKRIIETGLANLTYYDFPLPQHRNSQPASNAAACAEDEGKFWAMHDQLFANQDQWNTEATDNPRPFFVKYAQMIGLNGQKFESCYDARTHQKRIEANLAEGERRRVNSTPTFMIGDNRYPTALSYDELKKAVDSATTAAK